MFNWFKSRKKLKSELDELKDQLKLLQPQEISLPAHLRQESFLKILQENLVEKLERDLTKSGKKLLLDLVDNPPSNYNIILSKYKEPTVLKWLEADKDIYFTDGKLKLNNNSIRVIAAKYLNFINNELENIDESSILDK